MDDRHLVWHLRNGGVRFSRGNATLWFEKYSMGAAAMDEFAALAGQGIEDIKSFLQVPRRAKSKIADEIRYFVSSDVEISYTNSRSVFLPAQRVRNRSAPYLHETFHALVPCRHCPLWFSEGFACYVQSYVAENFSGYDGAIFTQEGNGGVDADAAHWAASRGGKRVLPFIGKNGEPPALRSDRENVAAPFYVLSHSFVKFLAQDLEPAILYKISRSRDFRKAVKRHTGATPAKRKCQWLGSLELWRPRHTQSF
jgi:hypothetical protein